MLSLEGWRLVAVQGSALVVAGFMAFQIGRLQFRRSSARAVARPGTAAESSLYGALAPEGASVFDGFSYRVGARFAGRARVCVHDGRVSFCGPRGPYFLYWLWVWLMGLSLAATVPVLIWAAVDLSLAMLGWALLVFVVSWLIMIVGAGVWPGLGEIPGFADGHYPALEFALADVNDATVGAGWANGGLSWVLLPFVAGVNAMAAHNGVSWFAPDDRGREVRYALHCYDKDAAAELHTLLSGGGAVTDAGSPASPGGDSM